VWSLARTLISAIWRRRLPCILWAVAVLAFLGEVVLLLTAAYVVDLALSLAELWAELARKHLEITLGP
jgi:hypothetical protein